MWYNFTILLLYSLYFSVRYVLFTFVLNLYPIKQINSIFYPPLHQLHQILDISFDKKNNDTELKAIIKTKFNVFWIPGNILFNMSWLLCTLNHKLKIAIPVFLLYEYTRVFYRNTLEHLLFDPNWSMLDWFRT